MWAPLTLPPNLCEQITVSHLQKIKATFDEQVILKRESVKARKDFPPNILSSVLILRWKVWTICSHFCEPKKLFKTRYLVVEFINLVKSQFFLPFHAILKWCASLSTQLGCVISEVVQALSLIGHAPKVYEGKGSQVCSLFSSLQHTPAPTMSQPRLCDQWGGNCVAITRSPAH